MNKKVPPIKQKNKKGFTLIELLVVVAIIGTLMSLISVSYLDIRAKSRDARRVNDVKSLRDGMALYQIQHTVYPLSQNETAIDGGAADVLSRELITEKILPGLIKDPNSPTFDYTYQSLANGASYIIHYCLETNSVLGKSSGCNHFIGP